MLWGFSGNTEQTGWLDFEPVRILYEYDIPHIFICKDTPGQTYLAYLCGRDREYVRFLVVPCSTGMENELVSGNINLRDALAQDRAWIFDLDNHWEPRRAWRVSIDDLPPDTLPKPGVMLYANLTPVIKAIVNRRWANEIELYDPHQDQAPWMQTLMPLAGA